MDKKILDSCVARTLVLKALLLLSMIFQTEKAPFLIFLHSGLIPIFPAQPLPQDSGLSSVVRGQMINRFLSLIILWS